MIYGEAIRPVQRLIQDSIYGAYVCADHEKEFIECLKNNVILCVVDECWYLDDIF